MRPPKALLGTIIAISFKYSSAVDEFKPPIENNMLSPAMLDSSMETSGTVAPSLRPSAASYDSAFSGGTLSGASFTVVIIYPVFSLNSQGSTKVATDTRPAIVFPIIDSAGQTVLVTSTMFDVSSSSPYAGGTESVSVSQAAPTSDQYSSSPPPSSVEIPQTLISTKSSILTSSFATDISLAQPITATGSSIENVSSVSQGSFSAPLRPVSDSITIMTIAPSAPYSNTTFSTAPYLNSTTSLKRSQPTHSHINPISNSTTNSTTNSTPSSTHPPKKCGDKYGHPAGTIITSYLAREPLCANGTLAYRSSPSTPNRTLSIDDVSWESITCYNLVGSIGSDAPLVYTINDGYRCFLYEKADCEVRVHGSRHKGGKGYKVGASGEKGSVMSYRCFVVERWAWGFNWARLYVGGPGYELF